MSNMHSPSDKPLLSPVVPKEPVLPKQCFNDEMKMVLQMCGGTFSSTAYQLILEGSKHNYSTIKTILRIGNGAMEQGEYYIASAMYALALKKIVETKRNNKKFLDELVAQIVENLFALSTHSHIAASMLSESVALLLNNSGERVTEHMRYIADPVGVIEIVLELMNNTHLEQKADLIEYVTKVLYLQEKKDPAFWSKDFFHIVTTALVYRNDREIGIDLWNEEMRIAATEGDLLIDQIMRNTTATPALTEILLAFRECLAESKASSSTLPLIRYVLERNKIHFKLSDLQVKLAEHTKAKEEMSEEEILLYGELRIEQRNLESQMRQMRFEIIQLVLNGKLPDHITAASMKLAKEEEWYSDRPLILPKETFSIDVSDDEIDRHLFHSMFRGKSFNDL